MRYCHPLRGWSVDRLMKKLLMIALAAAFSSAATAQLYKWNDRNGHVQYGDTPPGDAQNVTRLKAPPRGSAPAPAAPAAKKDAAAKDKALTPEEAFKKRQQERTEADQKAAKERADADTKRTNCEQGQAQLLPRPRGQNGAGPQRKTHRPPPPPRPPPLPADAARGGEKKGAAATRSAPNGQRARANPPQRQGAQFGLP